MAENTKIIKLAPDHESNRLCGLASASLDWITQNLNGVSLWQDGSLSGAGTKAFATFAILYGYLEELSTRSFAECLPLSETLPDWRAVMLQHCENPAYAEMVRERPQQMVYLLLPYLMLRATGYRFLFHEDTLNRLQRGGGAKGDGGGAVSIVGPAIFSLEVRVSTP